jgi:cytochrome c553
MRQRLFRTSLLGVAITSVSVAAAPRLSAQTPAPTFEIPDWVYPVPGKGSGSSAPRPDPTALRHVPNSTAAFPLSRINDSFDPPDWHPTTHSKPPEIVAHGRKPAVYACGFCHLPDGRGRPENAALAGLPAEYIVQQMLDIASGARKSASSKPSRPMELMKQMAESSTVEEMRLAAEYFSRQKLRHSPRVIESVLVPKTRPAGGLYVREPGNEVDSLGGRIIEFASDPERHELRDAATEYVAYVPVGSLARGRALATRATKTNPKPCVSCHGDQLRGARPVPPIAGRSPTYLMRQLLAFKAGTRSSKDAAPMREVVAAMTVDDLVAVAAYVASRKP